MNLKVFAEVRGHEVVGIPTEFVLADRVPEAQ